MSIKRTYLRVEFDGETRVKQVARLKLRGLNAKQIGGELGISSKTVEFHWATAKRQIRTGTEWLTAV